MSAEEEKTEAQIEAIEKETRSFSCPDCGAHLQFRLSVQVKGVQHSPTGEECAARDGRPVLVAQPTKKPVADTERAALTRLIDYYRDTGLLDAFEEVAIDVKREQAPKNMGRFFLSWLRTSATASLIPKIALQRLINEFDGKIEVYTAREIGAVVCNGHIRCFVPMHLLRGEVVRLGGGSNTKLRTRATDERLETWIKTKHGYVAGKGPLFQEMQKRAKGSFDNVMTA